MIGVVAGGNFVSDDDSTGVARKCVEIALQVRNYPLPPSTTKVIRASFAQPLTHTKLRRWPLPLPIPMTAKT